MKLNNFSKATQLSLHNSGGDPRVIIANESDSQSSWRWVLYLVRKSVQMCEGQLPVSLKIWLFDMGMIFNCYIFLIDQRNQFLQLQQLDSCVSVICVTVHFRNKWLIGSNMNSRSSKGKSILLHQFSSVQSLSRIWLFVTSWTAACQASLSITSSRSLPKLMSILLVMPSNRLILCRPLLLLPSIFPSIRIFSNDSALCMRWPKYWSFSFSISPSNEHPGLISFRMDWLDFLVVQGTLKSLLQHHSSKASILLPSAFFIGQLSHPYITTGKSIALTRQTFVGKLMSLLFNMLSRLLITFLPRSKCLLISWLQSPSAVILEPPPNKASHCFHCFSIYLPWSDGTRCHDLSFLNVEF